MKGIKILVVATLSALVFGQEGAVDTKPVDLTADSFYELVVNKEEGKVYGNWFVKMYAPWCGHCKKLAPTWEELASESAAQELGFNVGKVDCTVHGKLCQDFGVKGYPTLIYLTEEKLIKYKGARNLDGLREFAKEGYKSDAGEALPGAVKKDDL